jgi:FixJ family two-component response regulator
MLALTPTVFIIDPDAPSRDWLRAVIRRAGWTPRTLGTAGEFLAAPRLLGPSCLVLDVSVFDLGAVELLRRVAADREEAPIIAISSDNDIPMTVRVMKAGAIDVLVKPLADDALLAAVDHAIARSRSVVGRVAELLELRRRHDSLTSRERQVMERVVAGDLNKKVATALGISEITVKVYRGQLMRKMGAESLAHLVTMAMTLDPAPVWSMPSTSAPAA